MSTDATTRTPAWRRATSRSGQRLQWITALLLWSVVGVPASTGAAVPAPHDAIAAANGLRDAWVDLVRNSDPPAKGEPALLCDETTPTVDCETVDKVFYRSGDHVTLGATGYRNAHTDFATEDSTPLSDHFPTAVDFAWSCIGTCVSGNDTEPIEAEGTGSSSSSSKSATPRFQ